MAFSKRWMCLRSESETKGLSIASTNFSRTQAICLKRFSKMAFKLMNADLLQADGIHWKEAWN